MGSAKEVARDHPGFSSLKLVIGVSCDFFNVGNRLTVKGELKVMARSLGLRVSLEGLLGVSKTAGGSIGKC